MAIKFLTIFLSVIILFSVIELIRKEKLTFKYALGWLIVSIAAILATVFDHGLFQMARFFGFQLPSNFIFFSLLSIFVFLSLVMTIFLCQQNSRNDAMAQKIALLEFEIKELKKQNHPSNLKHNDSAQRS